MSNLGELFKQIRLSKNWSIRQAAKNMGLSYSYLSILEKGVDPRTGKDSCPKPETLRIISKAYDYPYEELMKAAGYLNDDNNSNRGFNPELFVDNIKLLIGKMTIEEFSEHIHTKTGYLIKPSQIRSYLNGDIQPFPGTLNILCKYAEVTKDFWYLPNNEETLELERKKYRENLLKASSESYGKDYISFSNFHEDVRKFILSEDSLQYIKVAMEAYRRKLNPNTLKLLIETIASEVENAK